MKADRDLTKLDQTFRRKLIEALAENRPEYASRPWAETGEG